MNVIGTFHGTEVDFAKELVEARKLMEQARQEIIKEGVD